MSQNSSKTTQGFTLVETLIAVLLLSVSLIPIVSIMTRTFTITTISQQRFTATKIALQGIELVRNKRDNNILCITNPVVPCAFADWTNNLVGPWEPDITDTDSFHPGYSFDGWANRELCISTQSGTFKGRHTYCDGVDETTLPGHFKRKVVVSAISAYSVAVTSTVTWAGGETLVLDTVLFNTIR